jgi:c(7)-type cytochrome triheme protein
MKKLSYGILLLFLFAGLALAQGGVKHRRPLPYQYGRVIINNYSEKAAMAPVVFDHWLHRAKYTCRVCHVDIGFSMKGDATGIKASDNMSGYYCGACHNGKMEYGGVKIFEACGKTASGSEKMRCERCHSAGKNVKMKYDFNEFTAKLPRGRFGNGVDWEKAEIEKLINPVDYVEGVSIKRSSIKAPKDFELEAKLQGMPDIIFSHKKHADWSGCELCHPEIFIGVKKGATKYTMIEIFDGKYCGVCHSSVAFPVIDCQRCHTKQVQ